MDRGFDDDVGGDVDGGETEHVAHTSVSALSIASKRAFISASLIRSSVCRSLIVFNVVILVPFFPCCVGFI